MMSMAQRPWSVMVRCAPLRVLRPPCHWHCLSHRLSAHASPAEDQRPPQARSDQRQQAGQSAAHLSVPLPALLLMKPVTEHDEQEQKCLALPWPSVQGLQPVAAL